MGFVSLTCGQCRGRQKIRIENTEIVLDCDACDGTGSVLIHTGDIKPYYIGIDPAGKDETSWATVWRDLDDGRMELIATGKLEPKERGARILTANTTSNLPRLKG